MMAEGEGMICEEESDFGDDVDEHLDASMLYRLACPRCSEPVLTGSFGNGVWYCGKCLYGAMRVLPAEIKS